MKGRNMLSVSPGAKGMITWTGLAGKSSAACTLAPIRPAAMARLAKNRLLFMNVSGFAAAAKTTCRM